MVVYGNGIAILNQYIVRMPYFDRIIPYFVFINPAGLSLYSQIGNIPRGKERTGYITACRPHSLPACEARAAKVLIAKAVIKRQLEV
jgi:hypothetical protein